MKQQADFDAARAHRYFAAHCFNSAWDLIDRTERSPQENEQMIQLAHASLWHWTQRDDCTPRNLSIGYWQLSRIYALTGQAENARRAAERCLSITPTEDAFCCGYANEALARADLVAGNAERAAESIAEARRCAELVTDAEDKQALLADLDSLAG